MDHAVHTALETDEQAELGDVAHGTFDVRALGVNAHEGIPRIVLRLLEAQRNAALVGVDFEDLHLDLLARGDDLAGVDVLFRPAHFGDVDQALDAGLQLDERAVVGDVRHHATEAGIDGILRLDALPGIGQQLLHAQADALGFGIDADDLHLHGIADVDDVAGMIDPAPSHIGHVQQAVDAAQIDERTVIGDVLDDAIDDLAFLEAGDDLGALLGARFLEHGAARNHDVAAPAIHLEDLERLVLMHQRADVTHGANVDLAARQKRHRAVEVDREATLDLVEDDAFDLLAGFELLLETGPAFLAAGFVARQNRFTQRILHALEIDFDLVTDLQLGRLAADAELAHRDAAFHLEADVDHGQIFFDCRDDALDDGPFEGGLAAHALVQQCLEIGTRWVHLVVTGRCGHCVSWMAPWGADVSWPDRSGGLMRGGCPMAHEPHDRKPRGGRAALRQHRSTRWRWAGRTRTWSCERVTMRGNDPQSSPTCVQMACLSIVFRPCRRQSDPARPNRIGARVSRSPIGRSSS